MSNRTEYRSALEQKPRDTNGKEHRRERKERKIINE
jgi:hypothetical protein